MKVITELGFEKPSEIQEKAIPQLIEGYRDFVGLAQTGTGKTAAFGLPLLERVDADKKHTQGLILAPTRELGQQIAEQMAVFSKYLKRINVLAVYGGASIAAQMKALRQPQHVLIATPGRLIDLIQRKAVKLDRLEYLILDEADEMLTMGFKKELDKILSYTPEDKLIWLFSATMSGDINRIVKKYMEDPYEVKLNRKNEVNVNIEHRFVIVRQANKKEALTRFLDVNPDIRGVVFCRTKRDTQRLADELLKNNYKADALHGDLSQRQRDQVMRRFRDHRLHVLVATDIAARGIDVNDLTHVFHYSLPDDPAYYTHRSGRTARAGKDGISVAFVNLNERGKIMRIVNQLGITIKRLAIPNAEDIYKTRIEAWCRQIHNQSTNGKLSDQLIEKANQIFGDLSKEELTAKLLMHELNKFNLKAGNDLNETFTRSRKSNSNRNGRSSGRTQKKNGHSSKKRKYSKKR